MRYAKNGDGIPTERLAGYRKDLDKMMAEYCKDGEERLIIWETGFGKGG